MAMIVFAQFPRTRPIAILLSENGKIEGMILPHGLDEPSVSENHGKDA
jgi:hypothetical protein